MRRFQYSLRALLGLTAAVAVGCAALVNASAIWASVLLSSALAALSVAILLVLFRTGATRAFWLGFAIFGWGYLGVIYSPIGIAGQPPSGFEMLRWQIPAEDDLATTRLLNFAYFSLLPAVRSPPPAPSWPGGGFNMTQMPGGMFSMTPPTPPTTTATFYPDMSSFIRVGHWLWTLLLAFIGGLLARYLYATRQRTTGPTSGDHS